MRTVGSPVPAMLLLLAGVATLVSCAGGPARTRGGPPAVRTMPASGITTDGAVLNGTVDPGGPDVEVWFEIGTGPDPASWFRTAPLRPAAASVPRPVAQAVRGLKAYTTYHFRIAARDASGVESGETATFPTGAYLVALGDSITAGSQGNNFESRLGDLLAGEKGYPNVVANLGVPGTTAAAGLDTIPFALGTFPQATYYLVMYGTNDAMLPRPVPSGRGKRVGDGGYAGSYKESLQKIVAAIRAAGKVPCLAKVPFALRATVDPAALREYNQVIDELAVEDRLYVSPPDFFAYFSEHPGELADGIHPNRAGYDAMAQLWLRALTAAGR